MTTDNDGWKRWVAAYYMVNPLPEHPDYFQQVYTTSTTDLGPVLDKLDAILALLKNLVKKKK